MSPETFKIAQSVHTADQRFTCISCKFLGWKCRIVRSKKVSIDSCLISEAPMDRISGWEQGRRGVGRQLRDSVYDVINGDVVVVVARHQFRIFCHLLFDDAQIFALTLLLSRLSFCVAQNPTYKHQDKLLITKSDTCKVQLKLQFTKHFIYLVAIYLYLPA